MELESSTIDDLLRKAIDAITENGSLHTATRGEFLEARGITLRLNNPRCRISWSDTRGTVFSAVGELLWYLSGRDDANFISYYIPNYNKEAEDNGTVAGAYGPRLVGGADGGQLAQVISMLRAHPSTRRAVIQLFDRSDIESSSRHHDVPCTCFLQFLIREDKLSLIAFMRSSDMYLGLPHDVFTFTMIQELVASELGVSLGEFILMAGSFHLYKNDQPKAMEYLQEQYMPEHPMPEMPKGNHRKSIDVLLEVESNGREYQSIQERISKLAELHSYWKDIGLLIVAFSEWKQFKSEIATSQQTIEQLRLAKDQLSCTFYNEFMLKKIDAIRRQCR